jgi:1-deoxy-D-xylulose-5-phosphate synthase
MAAENRSYAKVLNIGWPDRFIEHGSVEQLKKKYGLDAVSIARKAEEFIENKA